MIKKLEFTKDMALYFSSLSNSFLKIKSIRNLGVHYKIQNAISISLMSNAISYISVSRSTIVITTFLFCFALVVGGFYELRIFKKNKN